MISSAALMAVIGLAASFMPQELLGLHGTVPDNATVLMVQMAGAVYLGFAMLNWSAARNSDWRYLREASRCRKFSTLCNGCHHVDQGGNCVCCVAARDKRCSIFGIRDLVWPGDVQAAGLMDKV